jgi:XRE family transcriptional regulator, regulator of sulfur utilization
MPRAVRRSSGLSRKEIEVTFGQTIRSLREAAELSQIALAERSGYSVNTISKVERGLQSPKLETIFNLGVALRTRPSGVLRNVESRLKRIKIA